MVDTVHLDVLGFADVAVERKSAWGPGAFPSRQLTINGRLLGDHLSIVVGHPVEQSTPLVAGHGGAITPGAYLRALLGGPKDDPLRAGRIAIGYCDACLDASCGVLLAATLGVEGDSVLWSAIGFDQYDEGAAPKLTPFWKKIPEPEEPAPDHEFWALTPFKPTINLRFGREQYLEAIQSERRRLAANQ
jgi:hypothetical protein